MAKTERKTDAQKPEKKALYETVAEDLIKRMEAGTAPWQKPWNESANVLLPYNPTTGKNYKGLNTFALMMAGRDDPRWMTFKQADANQWQVKKGEKGTLINFYKFDEQKVVRDEKGKPVLDDKGKHKYITVKREKPIITAAWVFNAEQINGIPPLVKILEPEDKWQAIEAVENIVRNSGAVVNNVPGDRAFYSPVQDFIQMPAKDQFPDQGLYYATLLHEVGHWTGHKDRLNRDILNQFGTADYAKEELRAEIGSYMLGTDLKIGHDPERHASYVGNWVEVLKNDPYEIHRAASDAQKIFDYVKRFEQKQEIKAIVKDESSEPVALQTVSRFEKKKANFGLNEVINYKEQNYEVMALLKQGSLRMINKATDQVFILKPTDRLYNNLLKAKAEPLLEVVKANESMKPEAATINSAFEMQGVELEAIQRQSGFKR